MRVILESTLFLHASLLIFSCSVVFEADAQEIDTGTFPEYTAEEAAHNFNLQEACLPGAEEFPVFVRIGMTVSFTGKFFSATSTEGLISGLLYWLLHSKNDWWKAGVPKFCVIDDQSDPLESARIYRAFAGDPGVDSDLPSMDLLLGPSTFAFSTSARAIAEKAQMLMLLWSSSPESYNVPYLPESISGRSYVASSTQGAADNTRRLDEVLKDDFGSTHQSGASRQLKAQNSSMPYVLDLHVPYERQADASLQLLYDAGARSLLIVYVKGGLCPLASLLQFSQGLGYSVNQFPVVLQRGVLGLMDVFDQYQDRDLDVVLTCTQQHHEVTALYLMASQMTNTRAGALIAFDPRTIQYLENMTEAWAMNYILLPRPFGFLSKGILTDKTWSRDYRQGSVLTIGRGTSYAQFEWEFSKQFPDRDVSMMSLQILSCGAVIASALWGRNSHHKYTPEASSSGSHSMSVAQYIVRWAQAHSISTFDGLKQFDSLGRCSTCAAGVHQFLPLPAKSGNRTYAFERYTHSMLKIVQGSDDSLYTVPQAWHQFIAKVTPRMPSGRDRFREVYPCPAGCRLGRKMTTDLAGNGQVAGHCLACETGKYRSASDLVCRACTSGKYADEVGLGWCKECPMGADCNQTNSTPVSKPGWFRMQILTEIATSASTTSVNASQLAEAKKQEQTTASDLQCNSEIEPLWKERFRWVQCPRAELCLGNNQCAFENMGTLCTNCAYGTTFMGLFPNLRVCKECPSRYMLYLRAAGVYIVFFLLLYGLSYVGWREAESATSLVIPMLIILLRHFQILGSIAHSMALDNISGSFFSKVPGVLSSLFIAPFMVSQMDCLVKVNGETTADLLSPSYEVFLWGVGLLPYGYIAIMSYHMIDAARRSLKKMSLRKHIDTNIDKKVHQANLIARRLEMHMKAAHRWYHVPRQLIAWTMFAGPVSVHAGALLFSCNQQQGSDIFIMSMNSNVICSSTEYTHLLRTWSSIGVIIGALIVLTMLIVLNRTALSDSHNTISGRKTLGLLTIGWRESGLYFEVLYIGRGLSLIAMPIFISGRESVCFAQTSIMLAAAIFMRLKLPRVNADSRTLVILERVSFFLLIFTLAFGYVAEVSGTNDSSGIIKSSMVPSFISENEVEWANMAAMSHILFACFIIWRLLWNKLIVKLNLLWQYHGSIQGCSWFLLGFGRCVEGLNLIKLVRKDGEEYIDAMSLREHERHMLVFSFRILVLACMDSRDTFDMGFLMDTLQEVFNRADTRRQSVINDYEIRRMKKGRKLLPVSEKYEGGCMSGITIDELLAVFMDVEKDIISHRPDLHLVNVQAKTHHRRHEQKDTSSKSGVDAAGIDAETEYMHLLERDADILRRRQLDDISDKTHVEIGKVVTTEVMDTLTHLFSADIQELALHDHDSLNQNSHHTLQRKIAKAETLVMMLRDALHKTAFLARRKEYLKERSGAPADSAMPHISRLGLTPAIGSDTRTLHQEWQQGHQKHDVHPAPSSVYSPRARGLSPRDSSAPRSFWHGAEPVSNSMQPGITASVTQLSHFNTEAHESIRHSDRGSAPGLMQASRFQAELERSGKAPLVEAAAAVAPVPTATAATAATAAAAAATAEAEAEPEVQDALHFHFEAPHGKIHLGVFKAMLLSSARATGVPEATLVQFIIVLEPADKDEPEVGIVAHVQGPSKEIAQLRRPAMREVNVMGCRLLKVEDASPRASDQLAALTASYPTTAAPEMPVPITTTASPELLEALAGGRILDVMRLLEDESDLRRVLTPFQLERAERFERCLKDSIEAFDFELYKDWAKDKTDDFNFEFGCSVANERFRTFTSADFQGEDPVIAVAALLELHLSGGFSKDLISARQLEGNDPVDQIWQLQAFCSELGTKEDNIVQVSLVDSLTEEAGSLLICHYTPQVSFLPSLRGVDLPPPPSGMSRATQSYSTFRVKPLRRPGTSEPWGFNLSTVTSTTPTSVTYNLLRMMPNWGLSRMCRSMMQSFPSSFEHHMWSSKELAASLQSHPNAELYEGLRQRLKEALPRAREATIASPSYY